MPTPDEAQRLDMGPGHLVAELTRTKYTADDKAIRVMIAIIPEDSLILLREHTDEY